MEIEDILQKEGLKGNS